MSENRCIFTCVFMPAHRHTFGVSPPERDRDGGCIEQTVAKARLVPAPSIPLCTAPMGAEMRPEAHKPAWSCLGGSAWHQKGARWHLVAWCHFAPQPVTWKHWGQTERELHCVLVCIFGTEVKANTAGRVEGSGGLTPHGPSAVSWEAGRVMTASVLQYG